MTDDFSVDFAPVAEEVFGAGSVVADASRGPVGNGQETWFCMVSTGGDMRRVVVRRSAVSGPLNWTDRAAEFAALKWLQPQGLPTPPVLHFEPDGGRLERATIVMDHMPGSPLGRVSQEIRDRLGAELGHNLARLHELDVSSLAGGAATASAAALQQLDFWEQRYRSDALQPVPLVAALVAWLRKNQPTRQGSVALLWGDPGLYNMLHEEGSITALLDWELTHLGDPMEDLGAAVWSCRGMCDPELVVAAYEEESGSSVDRDELAWFEAFGALTRAIMLLNGARSVVEAEPRPSMMGLSLDLMPKLLRQAAATAGWPQVEPHPAESPDGEPASSAAALRPNVDETLRGIATYVDQAVLDTVDDKFVRRNLKTISALLRTSAIRNEREHEVTSARSKATADFLATLAEQGVDVSGGLEATAVRLEAGGSPDHQTAMRRHLLEDLTLIEMLLGPLRDLY